MRSARSTTGRLTIRTPWWLSILLAILCYCILKYLVPELQPTNPSLKKLVEAAPLFAPILTIPLLLLAAKQLYDGDEPDNSSSERNESENSNES